MASSATMGVEGAGDKREGMEEEREWTQQRLEELLAECQRLMAEGAAERQRFMAEWAEAAAAAEAFRRQLRAGMEKAEAERQQLRAGTEESVQYQSLFGEEPMNSDRSGPNLPTILSQIAQQQQANSEAIGRLAQLFAQFGERHSRLEASVEALTEAVARLAESLSGLPRNGGM